MNVLQCFFAAFVVFGCHEVNSKESKTADIDDQSTAVTLIFKHYTPTFNTFQVGDGIYVQTDPVPIKILDNFIARNIEPKPNRIDTIVVHVAGKSVLLKHKYNHFKAAQIVLLAGDIIQIEYYNDIPTFHVLNRKVKLFDFSYDSLRDSRFYKGQKFTALQRYNYPELNYKTASDINFYEMNAKEKNDGLTAIDDIKRELQFIDSLESNDLMSRIQYRQHSDFLLFSMFSIQYKCLQIDEQRCITILDSCREAMLPEPYSYFLDFCESYARQKFEKVAPMLKFSNGKMTDFRIVYDSIAETNLFPKRIRNLMLYKYLDRIGEHFSISDFKIFVKKFQERVSDTFLVNNLQATYFLDFDKLRFISDSVYLMTDDKRKVTLESFMKTKRGKVIFVDMWASWCAPCIESLPFSKKLSAKYHDRDVEVLVLSIDKNYENWRKASAKLGLKDFKNSFLIVNPESSSYLKALKIESIPRYLIYDKNGALKHSNAPDPRNPSLFQEIERLL